MRKLAALLLLVGLASCQSTSSYEAEIQDVDSLLTVIEGFEDRLEAIDSDSVSARLLVVNDRSDFLYSYYPDSNNRKFWISDMNYLGGVQKAYSRFEENSLTIGRKLEESHKQLSTLRNSLEDEKLSTEEVSKYLEDEAQVVRQIHFEANKMLGRVEDADVVWDSLRPYFDSIVIHYRDGQ